VEHAAHYGYWRYTLVGSIDIDIVVVCNALLEHDVHLTVGANGTRKRRFGMVIVGADETHVYNGGILTVAFWIPKAALAMWSSHHSRFQSTRHVAG
jgi:hypothetical protein